MESLHRILNTAHCNKTTHIMYILHRYLSCLLNTLTLWKWTLARSMWHAWISEWYPVCTLMWNWWHNGEKNTHKFTCKFEVFLYAANDISTCNAYSVLCGETVSCYCLLCGTVCLYIVFVTVCEQSGDCCTERLRHVTVQHRSNLLYIWYSAL
jgi:hypothetical protein